MGRKVVGKFEPRGSHGVATWQKTGPAALVAGLGIGLETTVKHQILWKG